MIANLQVKDYKGFTGGKNTLVTLTETPLEACLVAKDIQVGADGVIRKRPGYSLVQQPVQAPIARLFDYQRQSDDTQRVFVNSGGMLIAMDPAGKAAPATLSAALQAAILDFVGMLAIAYASNGHDAIRVVNNKGTDKVYNWGIEAAAAAPGFTIGPGSMNLQYGRQYVYCFVSEITDSNGTQWLSISNPSPISAQTGPLASSVVTLEDLAVSADPQVTHKWIFETVDCPANSTSAFYFAAEITNATTSWGDTLPDSSLDTTRQAPFNLMYPAPPSRRIVEYQSRIAAAGITGKPDLCQLSAYEEVDIGIPQEAFPPSLSFQVPGGNQAITGAIVFANSLMLATKDYWFQVTGYDAQTLAKQDRVTQPGAAGFQCVDVTATHMIWMSPDKKLWAWDGAHTPIEMSLYQRTQVLGTLSMSDVNSATLENAVLRYFSYGDKHLILLLCNTSEVPGPGFDWIMAWDLDSQGAPQQQSEVQQAGRAAQWDMFPGDYMAAMGIVEVAGVRSVLLGGLDGNVYSWPSGWTDNGKLYQPVYRVPWHHLGLQSTFFNQGPSALVKRLRFCDIATDRTDAATAFQVKAVVADGVNMAIVPIAIPVAGLPASYGSDPTVIRASHNQPGTILGRWADWEFIFPMDDEPASIYQYSPAFTPAFQAAP